MTLRPYSSLFRAYFNSIYLHILMKTCQLWRIVRKKVDIFKAGFLRINSMNQPFIYLQSYDNFGFDYEKYIIEY